MGVSTQASSKQLRESVTSNLLTAMRAGTPPLRCPWGQPTPVGLPCNFASRRRYSGVNSLLLLGTAQRHAYDSTCWGTESRFAHMVGAVPRQGEKPTCVTMFCFIPRKKGGVALMAPSGKPQLFPLMREFALFNVCQMTGKTEKATNKLAALRVKPRGNDYAPAENFLKGLGARIIHGGNRAIYQRRPDDYILLPEKDCFETRADYYETAFHETVHWCEDEGRLGAREQDSYAFRELVAELGACFLLVELGVPCADQMIEKSKSYLNEWLNQMGGNDRFIFDAARRASQSVDYLLHEYRRNCHVA